MDPMVQTAPSSASNLSLPLPASSESTSNPGTRAEGSGRGSGGRRLLRRAASGALFGRRWPLPVLLTLVLAALAAAFARGRGPRVPSVTASLMPLVQKVVATGRVRPPARIKLGSTVLGTVNAVPVDEGDTVRAGQLLLELDAAEAEAALRQARAAQDGAAARLERLRRVSGKVDDENLRQAEVALERAERELERRRRLLEGGASTQQSVDEAERELALARSRRESALAQAVASRSGGADAREALASLRQAEAAVAAARARLARLRIFAPADGLVLARDAEPGDIVQPGQGLLVLARAGPTTIEAQPDEKSLALLAIGQPARIAADAFPEQLFDGALATIAPVVDADRGTVKIELTVPAPPPFLRADMTVSVDIEVARRERALVLPAEAVRGTASAPYVLKLDGRRAARQAVRLGIRGDSTVEILEGLAPGDEVLLPGEREIRSGDPVRAERRS